MRTIFVFVVVLVAVVVLGLSDKHQMQMKQPRVYIDAKVFVGGEGSDDKWKKDYGWKEYFRVACPGMALLGQNEGADYSIDAFWVSREGGPGWHLKVDRRDTAETFEDSGLQPDAIRALSRACGAIRKDVEGWAGFEAPTLRTTPAPTGRYQLSYHPTNYNQAFLLDTKTGAVWRLERVTNHGKEEYETFERVSVDGLYTSYDQQFYRSASINQSSSSEKEKKESHRLDDETWREERSREKAVDEN